MTLVSVLCEYVVESNGEEWSLSSRRSSTALDGVDAKSERKETKESMRSRGSLHVTDPVPFFLAY